MLTGPLNEEQLSIVQSYTEKDRNHTARWVQNREERQKALVKFLRTKPKISEIGRFTYRILVKAHEITDPEYKAISDQRWKNIKTMYFELLTSLTPSQQNPVIIKFTGLCVEMIRLSKS